MPNAIAALVVFAILVPLLCTFYGLLASFSLPGATPPSDDNQIITRGLLIAALVSALAAIGIAIASAFFGRGVAVRVVAIVAIVIALVTGGAPALLLLGEARSHVYSAPPSTEPIAPSCGPESHPVVFGGGARYTACDADIATAGAFLDSAVMQLPIDNVTVASVDAVASRIAPETYEATIEFDNGDIVVAWYPAPVTCATAVWRDGLWAPEVVGKLAEGGCIYTGG